MKRFYREILEDIQMYFSAEGREVRRLRSSNRFREGTTELVFRNFQFVDALSFSWQYQEIFKRGLYNFIADNEMPVIIDCGANVGTSVFYFKKIYPFAEIIAFEPDPKIFKILKKNVTSGHLTNVTLLNEGVWNADGSLTFESDNADGGRIVPDRETEASTSVKVRRLSPLLNRKIDFLKIDIEGAEAEVIMECGSAIKNVNKIFIEYHSFYTKPQTLGVILEHLSENGFHYFVEQASLYNQQPFVKQNKLGEYDNLLNIFATRR